METLDLVYLGLVAVALLADHFVIWPRFVRSSRAEPQLARLALWKSWMGMLWVLSLAAALLWIYLHRPWDLMGLHLPTGWRIWTSAGAVLAVVALYAPTISKLCRISAERKAALRTRFGDHAEMLPETQRELAWFIALSLTAGFCEELIFRGYLIWALHTVVGLCAAAALSCLVFALAHSYQGVSGIIKTGGIGALLTVIVLAFGSLIPAIVIHALIDVAQGVVAWLVLRQFPAAKQTVAAVS
ncbi:CPBP family intramembrane glutamic endopeptidase [Dyella jiangningensis]